MANTRTFFRSFAGGEISPEMYGRVDADRYQTGAARVRNMVPKPQGPVASRPGFQFAGEVKDSTKRTRLVPFTVGTNDAYVLELGSGYCRIWQNAQAVVVTPTPATFVGYATAFAPYTSRILTTSAAHGFTTGMPVRLTHTYSTSEPLPNPVSLGVTYYVHVVNATNLRLYATQQQALAGDANLAIAPSESASLRLHPYYAPGQLVSYDNGSGVRVYSAIKPHPQTYTGAAPASGALWYLLPATGQLETPFWTLTDQELLDVHYVQSNDVMTLVHPGFPPHELRRYGPQQWAFQPVRFTSTAATPVRVTATARPGQQFELEAMYPWAPDFVPGPINGGRMCAVLQTSDYADILQLLSRGDQVWLKNTGHADYDNRRFMVNDVFYNGGKVYIMLVVYDTGYLLRGSDLYLTTACSVSAGTYLFTMVAHGLKEGTKVRLTALSGALPSNMLSTTDYWVYDVFADVFRLSTTDPAISTTPVVAGVSTGSGSFIVSPRQGQLQVLYQVTTIENTYRVTAVHADGSESEAASAITVYNNLFSNGAFNAIAWDYTVGTSATGVEQQEPTSFNVYKQDVGNYGLVGTIEKTQRIAGRYSLRSNGLVRLLNFPIVPDNTPIVLGQSTFQAPLPVGVAADRVYWLKKAREGIASTTDYYLLDRPDGKEIRSSSNTTIDVNVVAQQWFKDDNIAPDMGITLPVRDGELASVDEYPRAVCYFEGRRVFAGANNARQTFIATKSGTEADLAYHIPTIADDRVKFQIAARESATIRHVIPVGALLLLTNSTEWRASSVDGDALTPLNISVRPQSFVGANNVQPVIVNNIVVFCANRGGHVREMGYTNEQQGYMTSDLSLRASHLFDNYEITDLAYAKAPHPVLWFISTSGLLLGLSYIPEERVTAWHWHDTGGTDVFESCAVVAEGLEDRLYVVVRRTINGQTKRYVERMQLFSVTSLADTVRMDAAKTYSGGGPYQTFNDLQHLAGRTVSILADGKIHPQRQVSTTGTLTLDYSASVVHIGLPYTAELQTLPVTMQIDGFAQGRTKNVGRAWLRLFESHGFQIGPNENNLTDGPAPAVGALQSQEVPVMSTPSWQNDGTVLIRQSNPVPLTIIGMTLEVGIGS